MVTIVSDERAGSSALQGIFDIPGQSFSGPLLSLRGVSVRFGGLIALSDISFDVNAGEVVAIVGPNGAGKSTLLNCISGLTGVRASGSIVLRGQEVLGKSPVTVAKSGVARSFQDPPLIGHESVLGNVMLGQHLRFAYRMSDQIWRRRRVQKAEIAARERSMAILEMAGLGDLAAKPVDVLPYGVKKLVDISRALSAGPSLLLLDEPTSGLDHDEQIAVGTLIRELHEVTPVTTVLVEHHMEVVRSVADKVVGLHSGAVLSSGTVTEVLDSPQFRAALVGEQSAEHGSSSASSAQDQEGGQSGSWGSSILRS